MLDAMFDAEKSARQHDEVLIQIRLNYLREKITEKEAKTKVYNAEHSYEKKIAFRELMNLYLGSIYEMQHSFSHDSSEDAQREIVDHVTRLLGFCKSFSESLRKEFGGTCIGFVTDVTSGRPLVSLQ